ncbi:MAG: PAS domain-containing protein, partial [Limisphaerales bacterium]
MERVLGYAPAELRGTDSFAHVHPEDLPLVREMFHNTVQQP